MLPWNWQSQYGQAPTAEEALVPTVYVDTARRRDAEAFASQLEELGAPPRAPPEALGYARMDAAALLQLLAGNDSALLQDLQAAVLAKDMNRLCTLLEEKSIGTRQQRQDLKSAQQSGDKQTAAEVLRKMAQPALNAMMARSGPKPMMAMEVAGPHDPLMGSERRICGDVYLTGKPTKPDRFEMRRPPTQEADPLVFGNLKLGYDAAEWEPDCLFHAYLQDGANALLDLGLEAVETGELDGRLLGTRAGGLKY